jgi:hypothetical protein
MLRPVTSPLPISFVALATASFVLAGQQLQWVPGTQQPAVALCLLGLVVPLQGLGLVLSALTRDPIASVGMALLFGSWFAVALTLLFATPGLTSPGLGLLLLASATLLTIPAVAALTSKPLLTVVLGLTALRFWLGGAYEMSSADCWRTATASVGLVLCVVAGYAAAALTLEDLAHRAVLPTFRTAKLTSLVQLPPSEGGAALEHEAGIRTEL